MFFKNIKGFFKFRVIFYFVNFNYGIVFRVIRSGNRVFGNVKFVFGGKKRDVDMRGKVFNEGFEGGNLNFVGLLVLCIEVVR